MHRLFLSLVLAVPLVCLALPAQAQSDAEEYYREREWRRIGRVEYHEAIAAYSTAISLDAKDANSYSGRERLGLF